MARKPQPRSRTVIDGLTGQVSEQYDALVEHGSQALRMTLDEVAEHPLTALAAAFAAGFLAEQLLRRRHH
jgi:ElaB/YqjD/DUF883 family membrane-anchored ribosome-binding protein